MTGESAGPAWPSSPPPPAVDGWSWDLGHVSELPRVRAQLRRGLTEQSDGSDEAADLDEAVAVAKRVPARSGGVEVRPVMVFD